MAAKRGILQVALVTLLFARLNLSRLFWWARKDLNLGPMDYESTALTAELRARSVKSSTAFDLACRLSSSSLEQPFKICRGHWKILETIRSFGAPNLKVGFNLPIRQ
jgi:hypothetical protein